MNILLFGGAFNPPHLGHHIVIEQAFELIPWIDELWIMPTYNHAFGKDLAPASDRLAMCNLLARSLDSEIAKRVKVCSIEIDTQSSGSTYQTLQLLKQKYPEHTFSFLMGSDQLPVFTKWNNWQQLLEEMHFYVYPRGSHRHDVTFPNMELIESPTQVITNISSTLIRERLSIHQSISRIMNPIITTYIQDHHLYE